MNAFLGALRDGLLLFDGAMGTVLQQRGIALGELPELWNLTNPNAVTDIHRAYVAAGADVITANTFQAHELKLDAAHSVEEVVSAGVRCAKASGARFVALDVGPLGQLLEPIGTLSFARAYEVYRRQMTAGAAAGADLILIETISDPYEAKAAILAAKEHTALPVVCTMTFQEEGRTFVGCDPLTATMVLQGLGADAIGVNCSLGPERAAAAVDVMLTYARLPLLVQANAGLPKLMDGQTVYESTPEDYAARTAELILRGVRAVGGCCGTMPEHIRLLKEKMVALRPAAIAPVRVTACTSGTRTVVLDGRTTEIGERLNPTGKKRMQSALRAGDMDALLAEAAAQVAAGAHVLDVNVGLPELDEPTVLANVVRAVQTVTDAPLQIDSASPEAMEAALRVYNGKPMLNSVSGKRESLERILPLAKKYGALVVCLTMDEDGIPATAEGRVAIARRIRDAAVSCGIPTEDLVIDCLVLTASARQDQVRETLAAVRRVKAELGLKTVLGVSNVSFGLPERERLNAAFLTAALGAGLDAAILNPLAPRCRAALDGWRVLSGEDQNAARYIERYTAQSVAAPAATEDEPPLAELIEQGRRERTASAVRELLKTTPPTELIDRVVIPALDRIGARFERGEIFLPQLMLAAQAVQAGFAVLRDAMRTAGESQRSKGKILLATVHGDIHDIGKNIVRLLLETYGYEVVDLGKDVPADAIVAAVRAQAITLVGLSTLMTTTVGSMKDTIAAVRAAGLDCTFFVGGAVLSPAYAAMVGAEHYAKDAMEGVAVANRHFGQQITDNK